jgi:hypothetical protein
MINARPSTPPTAPPTIAPVDELLPDSVAGDAVAEADVAEAAVANVVEGADVAGDVEDAVLASVGMFVFPAPEGSHMSIE